MCKIKLMPVMRIAECSLFHKAKRLNLRDVIVITRPVAVCKHEARGRIVPEC